VTKFDDAMRYRYSQEEKEYRSTVYTLLYTVAMAGVVSVATAITARQWRQAVPICSRSGDSIRLLR
jgi:hypothetical protein